MLWIHAFALFVGVCNGAPGSSGRFRPTIENYPSLVQVEHSFAHYNIWVHFAGGTIVSNNVVISYGQFFVKEFDSFYSPENRRIRAGTTYSQRGGVIRNVASALTHPGYLSESQSDLYGSLCIVRLRDLLVFGPTINAVPIPPQNWEIPSGSQVTQAGWGETPLCFPPFDELEENTAVTMEHKHCYDRFIGVSNDTICSGFESTGVTRCPNDYGGPVYFGGALVGVFLAGGCRISFPSVSTQVSAYTDWIVANAN